MAWNSGWKNRHRYFSSLLDPTLMENECKLKSIYVSVAKFHKKQVLYVPRMFLLYHTLAMGTKNLP